MPAAADFCAIGNARDMGHFGAFWSQYPRAIDVLTVNDRIKKSTTCFR